MLQHIVPPDVRDVVEEMDEEYRERRLPEMGRRAARRWYAREARSLIRAYLPARILHGRALDESVTRYARRHRLRFGYEGIQENRGGRMERLWSDIRQAARSLRRRPGFLAAAVLTLGIGVGATTAMFSVMEGVLLQGLPYEDAGRIAMVFENDRLNHTRQEGVSGPDFRDWQERQDAFEELSAWQTFSGTLSGEEGAARRVLGAYVSPGIFDLLGIRPATGRGLTREDEAEAAPVAVLDHGIWRERYGADAGIVGSRIVMDGVSHTVVGVLPEGVDFVAGGVEVFVPLSRSPAIDIRGNHGFLVVGRLARGLGLEAAGQQMQGIMTDLEAEYPDDNIGRGATVVSLLDAVVGDVRPTLLMLMGAAALVLLIACLNIVNLLLGRWMGRSRDTAIRTALGAGRLRIGQFLLAENLLVAVGGSVVGVLLAWGGVRLLSATNASALPLQGNIEIDPMVLLFAVGVSLLCALLSGLLPAAEATRTDPRAVLSGSDRASTDGRGGRRFARTLVVVQVALALLLVSGTGLMTRTIWNLLDADTGYEPEGLVSATVNLPAATYPNDFAAWPDVPEVQGFYEQTLARLDRIPAVRSAALAALAPTAPGWTSRTVVEGGPATVAEGVQEERIRPVSPGYFKTIRTFVVGGRAFTEQDDGKAPLVAIVNQAFVHTYFPEDDPIGKWVSFWGPAPRTIIGVVADVSFMGISAPRAPAVYVPMAQVPVSNFDIVVRASDDPRAALTAIRDVVGEIDGDLAVYGDTDIQVQLGGSLAAQRVLLALIGSFSLFALLLAAIGIYGVVAYGVGRRTREFGVRLSLGATRGVLLREVLLQGVLIGAVGVVIGLTASLAATRTLASQLYGVSPQDPLTLGIVAFFLLAVTAAASFLPAYRASRLDPLEALREE